MNLLNPRSPGGRALALVIAAVALVLIADARATIPAAVGGVASEVFLRRVKRRRRHDALAAWPACHAPQMTVAR